MKKKWKIVTAISILTITCGLYTWGIPAIVNIKAHKSQIEDLIYKNTGFRVDIGNPKLTMGVFPSVWIKSDKVALINDDGSNAALVVSPKAHIKLLPLLKKKIVVSSLSAKSEEFNFVFTKDSEFRLGQYLLNFPEKKSDFELSKINLDLGKYNIILNDQKYNQKITYSGKYFKHGEFIPNKQVRFATDSTLELGKKSIPIIADVDIRLPINRISEDTLNVFAQIENLDLSAFSHYVKYWTNGVITDINGSLSVNADTKDDKFGHKKVSTEIVSKNLKVVGKDEVASIVYPKDLVAKIDFGTIENGIIFKDVSINSDNIHAYLKGKIYNLGNKMPSYNINVGVKDTKLEDVVAILPWTEQLPKEFNFYKLKKYKFYGKGDGDLTFRGNGTFPNVKGFVKLRDAFLIHPIKGANDNAKIDLDFVGKKMNLNVYVPTTNNQYVKVDGFALIDGSKYSELNIKSSDSVVLEPAQEVLVPLHEILNFQIGPVPMMKI